MRLEDVQPGDVFLLRSRGYWYSDAIAWFMGKDSTGNELSHCGIVLDVSPRLGPVTLETSDFEVTYGALAKYTEKPSKYHLRVYRLPREAWERKEEQDLALYLADAELYGRVYGYLQLLSLGVRRLLMRVGIRIPNFIRQGQVCTAVALTYCSHSRLPVFFGLDPEAFDTVEFAEMLYTSGAELVFESGEGR